MSPVIATYAYLGPTIVPCGNPAITTVYEGNATRIPFLTTTFDSVSGNIVINLPNKNTVVKGTYNLRLRFTLPSAYVLVTGVSLVIFDVCDSSTFDSAP